MSPAVFQLTPPSLPFCIPFCEELNFVLWTPPIVQNHPNLKRQHNFYTATVKSTKKTVYGGPITFKTFS